MGFAYLERELRKTGDSSDKERASIIAAMCKARGNDIALPAGKISSEEVSKSAELDLTAECQRQSQKLIELGFHQELGLTETEYLNSLPKFEPQPKEYLGRFDIPLLVEGRIPWEKQAQLAGIDLSEYLRARISETHPYNESSKTPEDVPYAGWFNSWGQRFVEKIAPRDAINQLTSDEYGAGPYEGIAHQIMHPEFTRSGKYFDLIGYQVGSGRVPCLRRWGGGPGLGAGWGGHADGGFRPLVRGSKIVTR